MAALGTAYYSANPFEIDAQGVPLAGGQLFFLVSGTATPALVYTDPTLTTPCPTNTNGAVEADANGRFGSIWLSPTISYKVQLFTAATPDNPIGSQIWSREPFGPAAGGTIANTAGIIGEVRDFAGVAASVPSGWLLCFGQAVSRTTYASLFAVLGTTWGAGDSSTTFNVPDLRGRVTVGKDDMGGTPANRITSGSAGINGTTLGASGGNQAMQSHTHGINDPGHSHGITDPQHNHQVQDIVASSPFTDSGTVPGHTLTTGPLTLDSATGITINAAATGITLNPAGAGASQNVQPSAIVNKILYAGV